MSDLPALEKCNAAKEQLIEKFKEFLMDIISYGTEIARGYPNHSTNVDFKVADLVNEINVSLSKINETDNIDDRIQLVSTTIKNMSDPQSVYFSMLQILDTIWYEETNDPDFPYKPVYNTACDMKKFGDMIIPLKGTIRDTVKLDLPSLFKRGKVPPKVRDYFDKILGVCNLKVEIMKIYQIEDDFNNQLKKINDEYVAEGGVLPNQQSQPESQEQTPAPEPASTPVTPNQSESSDKSKDLENQNSTLHQELTKKDQEIESLKKTVDELKEIQSQYIKLKSEKEDQDANLATLSDQTNAFKTVIQNLSVEKDDLAQQVKKFQEENAQIEELEEGKKQVKTLEEKHKRQLEEIGIEYDKKLSEKEEEHKEQLTEMELEYEKKLNEKDEEIRRLKEKYEK